MNLSEEQLALCKKYDAKSQRELYDFFKDKVLGLCRRYTSNKDEAKDVFQETFIRVFQRIGQLNDPKDLDQWITRVSINTAINYFHKTKRHHYLEERNGYHHQDGEYELILSRFSDEMIIELINSLPLPLSSNSSAMGDSTINKTNDVRRIHAGTLEGGGATIKGAISSHHASSGFSR